MSTTQTDAQTIQRLRQENTWLRQELAETRREREGVTVRPEFRLTERHDDPPPKPRMSLEKHRALVAEANEMLLAPDRPEDPDA